MGEKYAEKKVSDYYPICLDVENKKVTGFKNIIAFKAFQSNGHLYRLMTSKAIS